MSDEIIPRYTVYTAGVDDNEIALPTVIDDPIPAGNTAYRFYFDEHLLPITPGKYEFKSDNKNEKMDMFNGNVVSDLHPSGLHEYNFDFEITGPTSARKNFEFFTSYIFHGADQVIEYLREKDRTRAPFEFVITDGKDQSIVNETVVIGGLDYVQDNDNADDYTFSIVLREHREQHNMQADVDLNHHLILAKYVKGWRS